MLRRCWQLAPQAELATALLVKLGDALAPATAEALKSDVVADLAARLLRLPVVAASTGTSALDRAVPYLRAAVLSGKAVGCISAAAAAESCTSAPGSAGGVTAPLPPQQLPMAVCLVSDRVLPGQPFSLEFASL